MAEKNNATCSICGKDYHMCLSCKDSMQLAPWKVHTDTSEHYKVFQIIRGVSTGVYNKDEARTKLKNVDLSDLNSFRPHIKKVIKDILKEPTARVVKRVEIAENLAVGEFDKAETEKGENKDIVVKDIETTIISRKGIERANDEVKEAE